MDKILIRGLKVKSIIGTRPTERVEPQEVIFDLELEINLKPAGESDNLTDTVNYAEIEKKIYRMAKKSSFQLIESLAEQAANICLENKKVMRAIVAVNKPGALRRSKGVAVKIERCGN